MKYYMAPLEGITGYLYRNTYHKHFEPLDKYFTPFISPNQKKICRTRERNDILPEHNEGMNVVPQILTNRADMFLKTVDYLKEYGYEEVNLNIGCPVGTVVSKKKGAGFLSELDDLKRFLSEIYEGTDVKISIKTRIGMENPEEFEQIVDIYNQFPLHELIIHPRTREDYYKNTPHMESFTYGYERSNTEVCYNGDIFTKEKYDEIANHYAELSSVMLGRGILRYPGIVDYIQKGTIMKRETLKNFHDDLYFQYKEHLYGEKNVLFKMKEIWSYMIHSFERDPKMEKRIRKAQHLTEYNDIIRELFSSYPLIY